MHSRRYRNGVVNIEIIISLVIILMLLPILYQSFFLMTKIDLTDEIIQDEIATYQIRRKLLLSDNFSINNNDLFFDNNGNRWHLYLNNNHLLLSPGSQIIYNDIEKVSFEKNGNVIYVTYVRNKKNITRIIGNCYE